MRQLVILLLLSAIGLSAQGLVNSDLEKGSPGSLPEGWIAPASQYEIAWAASGCRQGNGCVRFQLRPGVTSGYGNLMQMFSAEPFRGKQIRYRAAVNVSAGGRANLWLRVDRPGGAPGFFDNMNDRPIATQGNWQYFEINAIVHPDADYIALGILTYAGTVLFDDASVTITGDAAIEPARPLTESSLANLLSFTKLYGIVRHFHPSDEAAAADWERIAIDGARKIETAANPAERVRILQSIFEPVAPTIRIFTGADPALPAALAPTAAELSVVRWHNHGFASKNPLNGYRRELIKSPASSWKSDDIFRIDLGQGVQALVPLAVFAGAQGTLPHRATPDPPAPAVFSADSRATRVGDVVLMWNILKHFYPYFDIAHAKWDDVLPVALREAAADKGGEEFRDTLARMVAALEDGHGRVNYRSARPQSPLPLTASWIEGKFIVTTSTADAVKPGDEILAINGMPAKDVLETAEKLISGATPQWKRARSSSEVLNGPPGTAASLKVQHFGSSQPEQLDLQYPTNPNPPSLTDPRPKRVIAELEPGIWYVDLTRAQDQEFRDRLTDLAAAKGIVFDMRGYPRIGIEWFRYVSPTELHSPQWHFPLVDRPDEMLTERSGEWNIAPAQPYLAAKKVFLTNGSAISYAESTMGIIENYKLGEIVGETTAGTNGNVNPVDLPGGYTVVWTGMKVLKHDGSRHHGVGIAPTVPVSRTQAGVAAGRDEVLERGLSLLKK